MAVGVLLVNLGTPLTLSKAAIRRYLAEFLMDPRVVDIPKLLRALLVYGVILPLRPRRTLHAYASIWEPTGSPLRHIMEQLAHKLGAQLEGVQVVSAMRYGEPGLEKALLQLRSCKRLLVIPMYPQYASSSTGSTLAKVYELLLRQWDPAGIEVVESFFDHPAWIDAVVQGLQRARADFAWDHLLLSYHGIPERHLVKSGCGFVKQTCQNRPCPLHDVPWEVERFCYRHQCYVSSENIRTGLGLGKEDVSVSFQSRLGRTPWIRPFTDEILEKLYAQGVRKLAVACPSFTVDCLETREEIGIGLRESWLARSGTAFHRVECLNVSDVWVEALAGMVRERCGRSGQVADKGALNALARPSV